jgi:hypothetical protein
MTFQYEDSLSQPVCTFIRNHNHITVFRKYMIPVSGGGLLPSLVLSLTSFSHVTTPFNILPTIHVLSNFLYLHCTVINFSVYSILLNTQQINYFNTIFKKTGISNGVIVSACPQTHAYIHTHTPTYLHTYTHNAYTYIHTYIHC